MVKYKIKLIFKQDGPNINELITNILKIKLENNLYDYQ